MDDFCKGVSEQASSLRRGEPHAAMSSVDTGAGNRLFFRDWGEGPPVVLLAGWGMDSRIWGEVMFALNAAGLRAIAYDRRGHGRSSETGGTDYDCLADDLAAVLEALQLRDVTLLAHSGGAGEVIRYISRYGQDRLSRIILAGATGPRMLAAADNPDGIPPAALDFVCDRLATDLSGWIDENVEPFAPGTPQRVNDWMAAMLLDCSRRTLVDFQRVIAEADLTAEATALDLPVTLIHGDRDVSAPIGLTARRYAELIPDAELLVYEEAAHGLMITHATRLAKDVAARVHARKEIVPNQRGDAVDRHA